MNMNKNEESSFNDFMLVKYDVEYYTDKLTNTTFRDYIKYLLEEGFFEDVRRVFCSS